METTLITISLPEHLKQFIEAQVASGRSANSNEFIESLLNEEEGRQARLDLENKLREGLQSGFTEMTAENWESLRSRVWERAKNAKETCQGE